MYATLSCFFAVLASFGYLYTHLDKCFSLFVHSVLTGFYCRLVSSAMQWIGHDGLALRLTDSLLRKQLATKTVSSRPFGSTSGGSRGRRKHHPTMTVSGQSRKDPGLGTR